MNGSAERDDPLAVRVDAAGVVRLTWSRGLRIDGPLAQEAMTRVDALNAGRERPLLVDMTGTAQLRRALLVPHVVRLGVRAPRDVSSRWDRYWAAVETTGDGGDVLWDSSSSDEVQRYLDVLTAHADPDLPVVDIGCGNGRFTRALATRFTPVLGVDVAAPALVRARQEAGRGPRPDYRLADLTAPGVGLGLGLELGPCNVFIRGVLHVLDVPARRRVAANVGHLVGARGTALIAETNYPGPLLGYLESLGAGPRGLPGPLARAISAGLPRPSAFGDAELEDTFPRAQWHRVLADDSARISTVPLRGERPQTVPGYLAVLRQRIPGPQEPLAR